jgi:hypothetical protein
MRLFDEIQYAIERLSFRLELKRDYRRLKKRIIHTLVNLPEDDLIIIVGDYDFGRACSILNELEVEYIAKNPPLLGTWWIYKK